MQHCEATSRNEAHLAITVGKRTLKKFDRLTIATKSNERLSRPNCGASSQGEFATPSCTP
jgi:hypothetical protein